MRLNLDTLTFVSNVWHDSRFAIQHFANLLDMCFGYAFGQVCVVTIQCEFLRYLMKERTEKYPDKIFEAAPRVFTQRLPDTVDTFLYFNQQTTLRIVLPELSNSQPVQNKLFAGYWIAVGLRGRNAPVPTSWIFHTARHALERPPTMARWNLPNIKFVTPTGDTWEEEEGHFRAWMKDMAPATFEFWMREAESWYEEGV
ncbi:hypothetical protein SLS60_009275 [Paraconiothyrium brasiliense]|uniref:Uncharacterized protein n=1 Tax=Paraconiothyrium brasiliense TaxID=300254 RepID=A0ABR3QWV1_9PLEO